MSRRRPPLFEHHDAGGARFTDFGGWEMPVSFDSIRTEHAAVRESAGKFDVSHMGQVEVRGADAAPLMDRLTTTDATSIAAGAARYATITDQDGIILDDTVLYRRADEEFLFVPNAGHDEEMAARWRAHRESWGLDATVENRTEDYAMIAIQGPEAGTRVAAAASGSGAELSRFEATETTVAGAECLLARTGYTGEDGFELILPAAEAESVWSAFDCQPCGLGARDTLRLEMGFLLAGQDFHPEENPRTPYEADVGFAVDLETEFVGRDALAAVAKAGVEERMVGIELLDRGVPRTGHPITAPDGSDLGTVTSGTMSPTLDVPIALGYVPVAHGDPGTELRIVVRDEPKAARVRATPFLDE